MDNEKDIVKAHEQNESDPIVEIFADHISRKEASGAEFGHAKQLLTKLYGGKRCIVCEMRGEKYKDNIESHHVFEWAHWNQANMQMIETTLRTLSPFIHGMYMISQEDILAGKPIPSLWDHPEFKDKPFNSLDDARNQYFLCHAHHQQSTKEETGEGYDIVGLHHAPFPQWLQYLAMKAPQIAIKHDGNYHKDINPKV